MGTIDLGKAVLASDDKEIKAAQGRLFKRVLYAAVIFRENSLSYNFKNWKQTPTTIIKISFYS